MADFPPTGRTAALWQAHSLQAGNNAAKFQYLYFHSYTSVMQAPAAAPTAPPAMVASRS